MSRMKFANEEELYKFTLEGSERVTSYFLAIVGDMDRLRYDKRNVKGREVHFLGEAHGVIEPVDYAHRILVPQIMEDPTKWLILSEDCEEVEGEPFVSPAYFYFRGLAELFKIPYEDALTDIFSQDVRESLISSGKVSAEDMDKCLTILWLCANFPPEYTGSLVNIVRTHSINSRKDFDPEDLKKLNEMLTSLQTVIKRPKKDILDMLIEPVDVEFSRDRLHRHWDDLSRARFHGLLDIDQCWLWSLRSFPIDY